MCRSCGYVRYKYSVALARSVDHDHITPTRKLTPYVKGLLAELSDAAHRGKWEEGGQKTFLI